MCNMRLYFVILLHIHFKPPRFAGTSAHAQILAGPAMYRRPPKTKVLRGASSVK